MTHTPIADRPHPNGMGGTQKLYRFPNGYGASVVRGWWSYGGSEGLWELAVIQFESPDSDKYELTYSTPITSDVLGHLDLAEVEEILDQIAALKGATQ